MSFFSLLAITLLWPVMIATAIAIKLDSKGPVLFMQKRHGFKQRGHRGLQVPLDVHPTSATPPPASS